jgi:hypothetical protein
MDEAMAPPGRRLPGALAGADRRTIERSAVAEMLLLGGFALARDEPGAGEALAVVEAAISDLVGDADRLDPAEVVNLMKLAGQAGQLAFWRTHYVATGRRLLAGEGALHPPALADLPPRRFTVEIYRHFDLASATGVRRLRLPLPLAGPSLRDLTIAPMLPGDVTGHRVQPGRLEVRVPACATAITIGARIGFTALPGTPEADDAPDPIWLAESEGPIQVTPRVRALADRLAADLAEPAQAVHAFHDHLLDSFICGVLPYDRIGGGAATDWVLETGWYDCRLGAALLAVLCRARGIPARLVGGYLLWRRPTEHFWVEVHLPLQGWTAFDLLSWDLSAGGIDAAWRQVFAGGIDYRMRTQVLPRIFAGAAGGASGPAWHRLVRAIRGGTETRHVAIPDGRLLYREEIRLIE